MCVADGRVRLQLRGEARAPLLLILLLWWRGLCVLGGHDDDLGLLGLLLGLLLAGKLLLHGLLQGLRRRGRWMQGQQGRW